MSEDEETEADAEEQQENTSPLDDEEYLREQYHDEGRTQADIAEEHGVTSSTVSHYMNKHDIETRTNTVTDDRLEDEEWLREKYEDEEMTMQEIADEVGCSDGTVMRRLHAIDGIEIRRSPVDSDEDDGDEEAEADGSEPETAEADD